LKAFVTGANGFIGRHLVAALVGRGDDVTGLVRDLSRAKSLEHMGANVVAGDVTDRDSMREPMHGADVVFHLAGLYKFGRPHWPIMAAVNVDGTRNTLELATELGVPKIVHTSTVGVFGNTHGEIVDESYLAPKETMGSLYELTKWAAHYEVAVSLQQRGYPVVIVQPGGVTGEGDTSPHMATIDFFLRRMPVMFGAKSGLTLAHVDDIAEGHILAAEKGRAGESYILCGPALTFRQVFEMCEQLTGIPAARIWLPGWMATATSRVARSIESTGIRMPLSSEAISLLADYTFWASADKARQELDFTVRPVEEVLREVLEFELSERGS